MYGDELVAFIREPVPYPSPQETYEAYLTRCGVLGQGFNFKEIVKRGPRHMRPPEELWSQMVRPLRLANCIRARGVATGKISGLRIAAAFRPRSGAVRSAHKWNRALDLDLLPDDRQGELFLEIASQVYEETMSDLRIGIGTYGPQGWTRRVHLDLDHVAEPGHRKIARPYTWTIRNKRYTGSAVIAQIEKRHAGEIRG